jgi:hypothetical protein
MRRLWAYAGVEIDTIANSLFLTGARRGKWRPPYRIKKKLKDKDKDSCQQG